MIEQRLLPGIIDAREFELVHVEARRMHLSVTQEDSAQASLRREIFRDLARTTESVIPQAELIKRLLLPAAQPTNAGYAELMSIARQDSYIDRGDENRTNDSTATKREDYGKISGGERVAALGALIRRATFNSGFSIEALTTSAGRSLSDLVTDLGRGGDRFHTEGAVALNMRWPELKATREMLQQVRQRFKVQVWLPCHSEPGVANMNVDYAANAVHPSRVLCVNTNRRENAEVRRTQRYLGHSGIQYPDVAFGLQDEILACIDWRRASHLFHIPLTNDGHPQAQAKGLTLLALALIAEARNGLRQGFVAFHDTDIINPDEYLALDYLTVPLWAAENGMNPSDLLGVYVARTGHGRNNQPIHSALNAIVAEPGGEERRLARELAVNISLAPWPITGERMIRADALRRLPWTNDMTIESQINVMLAGEAVARGAFTTAHVMNPHPKFECADVTVEREWKMMNYCAHHHRVVIEHCNAIDKVLGAWTPADIKVFNERTSERIIPGIITNDAGATGSIAYATRPAYMLPSVEMLTELGLVNLDAVGAAAEKGREAIIRQTSSDRF
jgi:hypothetical protein